MAAHPRRPRGALGDAASSLWRTVDLLDDADIDVLRAEGEAACRLGAAELREMVDLLARRHAAAIQRAVDAFGPAAFSDASGRSTHWVQPS